MNNAHGDKRVVGPFTQLLPLTGLQMKGPLKDEDLTIVEDGGVVVKDGNILAVGKFSELRGEYAGVPVEVVDGPAVLLPGFVDCHTHICFAGSRAQDYALKLQGKTYLEIARSGGGIKRSVAYTRQVTQQALTEGLIPRIQRHYNEGVTTIEIKSGYGLNVPDELKMLRAIRDAGDHCRASVLATCLAAHTVPSEFEGRSAEYLQCLVADLLPKVKQEGLCHRVDIFIEDTAFNMQEAEWYLAQAKQMGFELTVHADQFTPGGSGLAVRMGAVSADHLEASGEKEITSLAGSETVAVVLPGASLGLGIPFAPARHLLDAGCCVAIASDWNPGSAPMGDLLLQAALLGVYQKLSFAETMAGITFRAAKALDLTDRGTLAVGNKAHMVAFATHDHREILYHQGKLKPFRVWTS
ncbi:MAG TPA: imidazolonepropionase [Phnomibacter sp.]|nr:imidazolonepropionase [Phnomibacter sp.]